MPKKKWEKPKLIVLVKGKLEEEVLLPCKEETLVGSAGTWYDGCNLSDNCPHCWSYVTS